MPTHVIVKTFKVKASGLPEPLYFNDLFAALYGCATLRLLGYKPTLTRNPHPETITLARWQAERGI